MNCKVRLRIFFTLPIIRVTFVENGTHPPFAVRVSSASILLVCGAVDTWGGQRAGARRRKGQHAAGRLRNVRANGTGDP